MKINENIFKAYDIRGRYPDELDEAAARQVATTLAEKVFREGSVVVAHDARLSSPALYAAVTAQLKTHNLKLITVGLATTPMFYFLVNQLKASGGIMITASHNPKEYNGLKVVGREAMMISGQEVWALIRQSPKS